MTDPTSFVDKVCIVTGAANGIGLSSVELLLSRGAKVMMVDIQEAQLEAAHAGLKSDNCSYSVADVSNIDQVKSYVEQTLSEFESGIDCLFSNAGIEGQNHGLLDYPLGEYDKVMAVNSRGTLIALQQVVPKMNLGGSVLLNASVAGEYGSPGLVAYHASKHALIGIMRTAALEFADKQISINCLNPGAVDTPMFARITDQSGVSAEEYASAIKTMVPMGRYADPKEIAEMAVFLLSDAASYCHGRCFGVDGGITAST